MFTKLKEKLNHFYHFACLARWMEEAYAPLFLFRYHLENNSQKLLDTASWLEETIQDLKIAEGKSESEAIKDRWYALRLEKALESYHLAIIKTNELLDNLPDTEDSSEWQLPSNLNK